jgi:hypothetical protein
MGEAFYECDSGLVYHNGSESFRRESKAGKNRFVFVKVMCIRLCALTLAKLICFVLSLQTDSSLHQLDPRTVPQWKAAPPGLLLRLLSPMSPWLPVEAAAPAKVVEKIPTLVGDWHCSWVSLQYD